MTASLVLTIIGPDRPGLVESLSRTLSEHEANWLESRMASLGGKFAGILLAAVPETKADALAAALHGLESKGLRIVVEKSATEAIAHHDRRLLDLELVGQDRPGIVREISRVLAGLNVNVEELHTETADASWSGEKLFYATAQLNVPGGVAIDEVQEALEGLANELMVDISLNDLVAPE